MRRHVVGPELPVPRVPDELLAGILFQRKAHAEIPGVAHAVAYQHLIGRAEVARGRQALVDGGRRVALPLLQHPLVAQVQGIVVFVRNTLPQAAPASIGVAAQHAHKGQNARNRAQVVTLDTLQLIHAQQVAVGLAVLEQGGYLVLVQQQQRAQLLAGSGVEVDGRLVVLEQRFVEVLVGHFVALNLGKQLLGEAGQIGRAPHVVLAVCSMD